MGAQKRYGGTPAYESKLSRVMDRLGVTRFEFDWSRQSAWIQFEYREEIYRFEHSVKRSQERGLKVQLGSDCFAQLVLSLEDLARMVERGIYDLSTWVVGMKCLPAPVEVPTFLRLMGFAHLPDYEECKSRYRELVHQMHPDAGGAPEDFRGLMEAWAKARAWFGKGEGQ